MTVSQFDQNESILDLEHNQWSYRNSFEGTQVFGSIGSGKTSGSGQMLAKAFLESGYGGLVLTAKSDEREQWETYCKKYNRSEDLIIFSPKNAESCSFNFLDYEASRSGEGAGVSRNIVSLFLAVVDLADNQQQNSGGDRFWRDTLIQLLDNAIDLLILSDHRISMINIKKIINEAPNSLPQAKSKEWGHSDSFCAKCLNIAGGITLSDPKRKQHFDQVIAYWTEEYPNIPEKTRSTIELTFTSIASLFLRPPLVDLMCNETRITPEMSYDGKIIVLDISVQQWNEIGRYAQVLFKLVWQRAAERRNIKQYPRPIFLWADEAQRFINEHDVKFQEIARSKRIATVYLTQNMPNYVSILGKERTSSLLGTLNTKIFHANTDVETNDYAVQLLGKEKVIKTSYTESEQTGFGADGGTRSFSQSEENENVIEPHVFAELSTGGGSPPIVEGVFYKNGFFWGPYEDRYVRFGINQNDATVYLPEYGEIAKSNKFYFVIAALFIGMLLMGIDFIFSAAACFSIILFKNIMPNTYYQITSRFSRG